MYIYLKIRGAASAGVFQQRKLATESQSFNETMRRYKGYQARQCCMEHVGKFDDTEVTALSHVIHDPIRRGTLNRKWSAI